MLGKVDPESDRWEQLDERFFAYEDSLIDLNLAFVRANIDEF